ncbi:transposase [Salmonella enterica subsp. houtenae]|nr:transposase [Salmonella enterica subsp. houtenae]
MPARSLCQKSFKNILELLHLYRRQSLIEATSVVINGASLTLIQYWASFVRSSIGQAQDKTYRSTSGKVSLAE